MPHLQTVLTGNSKVDLSIQKQLKVENGLEGTKGLLRTSQLSDMIGGSSKVSISKPNN